VVHIDPSEKDPEVLLDSAAMVATSGLLPLMSSRLQWPTSRGRALDGWLYLPFLPETLRPPSIDDAAICPGKCLIFGPKEGRDSSHTRRINPEKWRTFPVWRHSFAKLAMSSAPIAEELFAQGHADALEHMSEIEAAMLELFGLRPLSASSRAASAAEETEPKRPSEGDPDGLSGGSMRKVKGLKRAIFKSHFC